MSKFIFASSVSEKDVGQYEQGHLYSEDKMDQDDNSLEFIIKSPPG
jgi:hypothetical protein